MKYILYWDHPSTMAYPIDRFTDHCRVTIATERLDMRNIYNQ